jgi:hypothetical protein
MLISSYFFKNVVYIMRIYIIVDNLSELILEME